MNTATVYEVKFRLPGDTWDRLTQVAIIDGYSTLADIPKIIACVRTGKPTDAQHITILQITRVDSTD